MAQLVRAPPCHGGGRGFESLLGRLRPQVLWIFCPGIIAQLGEHLPYKQGVTGSSPVGPTTEGTWLCRSGGTGRRTGLKILRDLYSRTGSIPVCGSWKTLVLLEFFFCKKLKKRITTSNLRGKKHKLKKFLKKFKKVVDIDLTVCYINKAVAKTTAMNLEN